MQGTGPVVELLNILMEDRITYTVRKNAQAFPSPSLNCKLPFPQFLAIFVKRFGEQIVKTNFSPTRTKPMGFLKVDLSQPPGLMLCSMLWVGGVLYRSTTEVDVRGGLV